VAALCIVTFAAGVYSVGTVPREGVTSIAVGAVAAPAQERAGAAAPQTPVAALSPPSTVAGAVSLTDLARELMAKAATSTTRPPATPTTTVKRAATTTTSPAPTTTAAARAAARAAASSTTTSTTTPLTPLTTLLQKVAPPVAAVSGALTHSDSGVASWFNAPDGTCAHRTLPMGTKVKVTRVYNGASTTCKVDDRGPTLETGRLIDLSLDTFEKLAAAEAGLIDVTIEW
jgi:rare lipoprotein A